MDHNRSQIWICLAVESGVPWPTHETAIEHEYQLILRPETETLAPSIAFEFGSKGIEKDTALSIIRQYLSALAWYEGVGIREIMHVTSSGPIGIGKSSKWSMKTRRFDYPSLQFASTPKQQLALALYREALSVNSVPYKFLGFTKIVNIVADKGLQQKKWINSNLQKIETERATKVILDLKSRNIDVGEHVYSSGRCATAHAYGSPVIDPDSSSDLDRLTRELPLVKELAELVIEHELGIKSSKTVYTEHKYEVEGFREILPPDLIKEIEDKNDRFLCAGELNMLLNMGLRNKPNYYGLNRLDIEKARIMNGCLYIGLKSLENVLAFTIGIDLLNSRLIYDAYEGSIIRDNGSETSARCILGFYQFSKDLFLNGQLKFEDAQTEKLLGFKTAFIPVDVDVKRTVEGIDRTIDALNKDIFARCSTS